MSDPDGPSREERLAALAERDAVIAALLREIEQLKRRVGRIVELVDAAGLGWSGSPGHARQAVQEALTTAAGRAGRA